jgi:mitochondrial pyruvate carrier 1
MGGSWRARYIGRFFFSLPALGPASQNSFHREKHHHLTVLIPYQEQASHSQTMFSQYSANIVSKAVLQRSSRVVASRFPTKSPVARRWMTTETKEAAKDTVKSEEKTSWWSDAKFWGGLGAIAGWGMSGSAIFDATVQGPEVISLTMTPVLIVYSTLFARWAYVVTPPNPLLMYCHVANVVAQLNQLRRGLEYKMQNGEEEQVKDLLTKVAVGGAVTAVAVAAGPRARTALSGASLGVISTVAAGT